MQKTVTIAFANNKGGSGKTTTCANVGYALSSMGKRVLLLDGDMQMNLTLSFFPEETVFTFASSEKNIYYAIKNQESLKSYITHTPYERLDLIPSTTLMSSMEYELFTKWQREMILKNCLLDIAKSGGYDYILIDSPPTLGGWVMNILCASDFIIMPVEATPWGLFGIANMMEFLKDARKMNEHLSLLGIAITKVDVRKNYYKQTQDALQSVDGVLVFDQIIRVDSEIEWAEDNSKPVKVYKKSARSAEEFDSLAKEIDYRIRK